jgi:nitrogen-specific signal transduction histidine kinase
MRAEGAMSIESREHEVGADAELSQARRLETIGTFASGIAHNFNNIVTAIIGRAEMALDEVAPDSAAADSLREIRRAGERARELADQVLRFGRRSEAPVREICIQDVLAETRPVIEAALPPGVTLAVTYARVPTVVAGQAEQLQQVILNLANNAAQSLDGPGIVDLAFAVRTTADSGAFGDDVLPPRSYAVLTVSDAGRGMDAATQARAFEPFFTTRREGNGLGLAISREIVRSHGGAIGIVSAPGRGTRVEVWLPAAVGAAATPCREALRAVERGSGEAVLVLEADRDRRWRLEEVLAAIGYEPVGFADPAAAIEAIRAAPGRFDVALLCNLPSEAAAIADAAPGLPIVAAVGAGGGEVLPCPPPLAGLAAALARRVRAAA